MKLGRLGVWYGTDKLDGSQLRDFVRTVENNGYSNLWYPESRGYESMSLASWLLSSSEKLVIGSSIANIYARDSFTAQRAMVSLNALYGGRFILGLGVSHIPMVEGLRGHRYDKPLAAMSAYLDGINKFASAGELPPVVVAALGPKMLALSAARSRGAVPYNVTPEHTAQAAAILGPSKWLAVEQKVTLETDPTKARELGRKELSRYMALPNYRNSWLRQGRGRTRRRGQRPVHRCDGPVGRCRHDQERPAGALHRRRDACLSAARPRGWRFRRPRPHAGRARRYLRRAGPAVAQSRSATALR
jgi:probable F420-dependent oxidoreductase